MTEKTLLIPGDVGALCRAAAQALESSRDFLDRRIAEEHAWAEEIGEAGPDSAVSFLQREIERTRNNLGEAAKLLNWLAQHGDHGAPVAAVEAPGDQGRA